MFIPKNFHLIDDALSDRGLPHTQYRSELMSILSTQKNFSEQHTQSAELVTKSNCTDTNSVCNWIACLQCADTLPLSSSTTLKHNSCYTGTTHSLPISLQLALSVFRHVLWTHFHSKTVGTLPNASDPLYRMWCVRQRCWMDSTVENMDRET